MKGTILEQKIFKLIAGITAQQNANHNCYRHGDENACVDVVNLKKEIEKRRKDLAFSLSEVI
jgi:hypothetical protein